MTWRLPKRYVWPTIVGVVLTIDVGVGVTMMRVAGSDPSFAVEPDYYAKAVGWDSTSAQARRNATLGWELTPHLGPVAEGRAAMLSLLLRDRSGAALTGAQVAVDAIPIARAEDVIHVDLPATADGHYGAEVPMTRSGLWELRIVARRGVDEFTADVRVDASTSGDADVVTARPWDPNPQRLRAGMRPETSRPAPPGR